MPQTILMPSLSAGMEEAVIARWLKAVGDPVAKGEAIVEIETDKATMEYEAEEDGVLGRILARDGISIPVGDPIALLLLNGEAADEPEAEAEPAPQPQAAAEPHTAPAPSPSPPPVKEAAPATGTRRQPASPLARRTAQERGMTLDGLTGTGPRGRIVRIDVEQAAARHAAPPMETSPQPAPVATEAPAAGHSLRPGAAHRAVPNSNVRKVIARRLAEAKATIPHFYLHADCQIDALLDLRARLNADGKDRYKLSVNDFVVKAAAIALRQVPEVNAAWSDDAILLFDDVDISVAVSTEGGLITPILRNADQKGLATLSSEVKALAECAREGRLHPDEYQGGGFTISNLGMFGVSSFSAIINPPQSCILAVGAAERRPVIRDEQCVPATMMSCTLSVDHRSVDGALGARYLAAFKALIEQPLALML